MRYFLAILTLFALLAPCAADSDVLPFPVTVGGQEAAMTEKSSVFGVIANPVASNAVMAVKNVEGQIIVNIFPTDANGEAKQGAQPLILLFDGASSKAISDNMQGTKPAAGHYVANVVGEGKTSRVYFQVK